MLDVWPDVFAYGILLVPKDLNPGERRPVVVCQHGLEGRPRDVADPAVDNAYYHHFAARLAEEGFVTFAPQNPYIGHDRFRLIQRKAHPLKLSLFSFILGQHQRILEWLGGLPFVDREPHRLLRTVVRRQDGGARAAAARRLRAFHLFRRLQRMGLEDHQRRFALQLYGHAGVRHAGVRLRQHGQLLRPGEPHGAAALHGRARA